MRIGSSPIKLLSQRQILGTGNLGTSPLCSGEYDQMYMHPTVMVLQQAIYTVTSRENIKGLAFYSHFTSIVQGQLFKIWHRMLIFHTAWI